MGSTSQRGSQVTKFQEGIDGNTEYAYSNVESDLLFNGNNTHVLIPASSRYSFGTGGFSHSFYIETNSTDIQYHLQIQGAGYNLYFTIHPFLNLFFYRFQTPLGADSLNFDFDLKTETKIFIVVTYDGTNLKSYTNGILSGILLDANAGQSIDLSTLNSYIGSRSNGLEAVSGTLSYCCTFNRALSQQEISYIHTNGGIIPESAHANTIAHYPLTERYAYKADAAFAVKHPQFIAGDNVFFDTVEQYNYPKYYNATEADADITLNTDTGWLFPNGPNATWKTFLIGNGQMNVVGGDTSAVNSFYNAIRIAHHETTGTPMNAKISIEFEITTIFNGVSGLKGLGVGLHQTGTSPLVFYKDDILITPNLNGNLYELTSLGVYRVEFYQYKFSSSQYFKFRADTDTTLGIVENITYVIADATLSANHAKAVNFTDAELGINNLADRTAKIDFYKKEKLNSIVLNGIVDGTPPDRTLTVTDSALNFGTDDFVIEFEYVNTIPISGGALQQGVIGWALNKDLRINGKQLLLTDGSGGNGAKTWDILENTGYDHISQTGRLFNIKVERVGSVFNAYIDGKKMTVLTDTLTDFTTNGISTVQFFDFTFFQQARSHGAFNFIKVENKTTPNTWEIYFEGKVGDNIIKDNKGNLIDLTTKWTADELKTAWIEKQSLLPEIKQAFNFGGTRWFQIENFIPTKEKGYTYIFSYSLDSDRDFIANDTFLSNRSTKYKILYGAEVSGLSRIALITNDSGSQRQQYVPLLNTKLNSVNSIAMYENDDALRNKGYVNGNFSLIDNIISIAGWDELIQQVDTYIGKDSTLAGKILGGFMQHISIWKGEISQKDIKEITNNSLLANSNISKLAAKNIDNVLYINFNEGSFSEDGTNVLLKDHSPSDHKIKAFGLVGATSADQLADVPNHLVDINSLR